MSIALSSYILVIDLTGDKPRVLRRFDQHRMQDSIVHDRVIKGRAHALEPKVNGHAAVNGDMDVDMADAEAESPAPSEKSDEDSDSDEEDVGSTAAVVSVDRIAVSTDSQWLATSDNRARTHIFNLDLISVRPLVSLCLTHTNPTSKHHCVLPTFPRAAQTLVFDPMHPSVLLLAFPDNTIQIFDVETRQFPAWGKELGASLPKRFTYAHDPVLGAAFDPPAGAALGGRTRYILFWGATWLFKVSLDTSVRTGGRAGKRRRDAVLATPGGPLAMPGAGAHGPHVLEEDRQWRDYKMVTQYRPIACCAFLSKDELVVVERPLVDILLMLPPAYFKHKYGIS